MKKLSITQVALLLAVPTVLLTLSLRSENSFGGFERSDLLSHQAYVKLLVESFYERSLGLERWDPGCCFGSPVFRSYQNLPHYLAALITWVTKANVIRVLHFFVAFILAVQPLIFFLAARRMGLSQIASIAAGWLSPLVFSMIPLGHEMRSYVVFGTGLFPQLFAIPSFLFTLAAMMRATGWIPSTHSSLRRGLELGFWLALTFLLQHFYGYMALLVLSFLTVTALAMRWIPVGNLLITIAWAGVLAILGSGYQLLSIVQDLPLMHQTNWYHRNRWDGLGLSTILNTLVSGDALDLARFPTMTLLAAIGILLAYRSRQAKAYVGVLGIGIFFCAGRTTFGRLFDFIPGISNLHLERFIGLIHIAAIFLGAYAVGEIVGFLLKMGARSPRQRQIATVGFVALLVAFMLAGKERLGFLAENDLTIAKQNYYDRQLDPKLFPSVAAELRKGHFWSLRALDGNVPGLGRVPFFHIARQLGYPQLSLAEQSMTYTSDSVYFFGASREPHYRLFNVQAVLLPKTAQNVPDFLTPVYKNDEFIMYRTPARGYWDVIGISRNVIVPDEENYAQQIKAWLEGTPFSSEEYPAFVPAGIARKFQSAVPQISTVNHPEGWGSVVKGSALEGRYASATLIADYDGAYGLFRMAYHPRWKISVNGHEVSPRWAGAGFLAIPLDKGRNEVIVQFPEDPVRAFLFVFGLLTLGLTFVALRVIAPQKVSSVSQLQPAPGSVFA